MPYVSVKDSTKAATSPITGIYHMPQTDPNIPGYIGWLKDSDPRIVKFLAGIKSASIAEPGKSKNLRKKKS